MLVLAHRGAHLPETPGVRENTLDAFRAAADCGADGVELDVRRCRDGGLVVHHDAVLPDGRLVAEAALSELPVWVPTLSSALGACAALRLVNVEIKASPFEAGYELAERLAADVASVLAGPEGRPAGATLVSSFDLGALNAFAASSAGTPTGWLTTTGYDQLDAVTTAAGAGHRMINSPEGAVTADLVAAAHAAGLGVLAWTVNDAARLGQMATAGVDVVVTDRPRLAVSALRRGGGAGREASR